MSNCRFTVKDKNGNVKKQGLTEQEFKKYLAKEGLSEYIKSGDITTNMDFLKDYLVVPKEKSVQQAIKETTGVKRTVKETPLRKARKEGKYEGEVKTTEKLSKQIEKGKERLEQSKSKIKELRNNLREKFEEYNRFKTEKNQEALNKARQKLKDKLAEQRELNKEKTNKRIQELKDRVKEKIADIKEQGKSLADITKALRDDIKAQIKGAKDIFRGAKIRGNVVKNLVNKINNAKTPLQLLSAVDYVAKTLQDVEYTNKIDTAKSLANKVKRISGNLPINLKTAINNLAKVSPKEIKDVNEYIDLMNKAVEEIRQSNPSGINEQVVNKLAETISKNNLKNRIDLITDLLARRMSSDKVNSLKDEMNKELKEAKTAEEKQSIRAEYGDKINTEIDNIKQTFNKPVSDSIEDMKKSLSEFNEMLQEAANGNLDESLENAQQKRDNLETINEVLRDELSDFDTSGLDKDELKMFDALAGVDIERFSDKDLKFLNYAINNFMENGSFDGVGTLILSKYDLQQNIKNPQITGIVNKTIMKLNILSDLIKKRASLDVVLGSLFSDAKATAVFRSVSGYGDWSNSYGSKVGYRGELKNKFDNAAKLFDETKFNSSSESQHKLGQVLFATRYKAGLTPEQIQAEFEGRKKAILTSIERNEKELGVESWKKEYEETIKLDRDVYEKYIKDAKTPQELIDNLTDAEKKSRDLILKDFEDLKPTQQKIASRYKNEIFEDEVNYFPIETIPLIDAKIKSDVADNFLDNNGFGSVGNIQTSQSTAFKKRLLTGEQTRLNHVVNFNALDVYQNQYRKQLYDAMTLKERINTFLTITSPEFLELLGGNKDTRKSMIDAFTNRYKNEVTGLQAAKDAGSLLEDTGTLLKNSAVRSAIGGIGIPYIKQYAATFASVAANLNPQIWTRSFSVMATNGEAFRKFIAKSPVSLRHDQEVAMTGGTLAAKDLQKLNSSLRKSIKGTDKFFDEKLMNPLKAGDQSSAGMAYLSYYIKNLIDRGVIKNVLEFDINKASENPDKIAQQFAEQETATTLNINEAVNKPINPLFKNLAFVGFAVNAKLNMFTNIGKLIEANGVVSPIERAKAARKIAAHVAETYAFNKVGAYIRYIGLYGAYNVFKGLLGMSDDDEETKDKMRVHLDATFQTAVENNDKNSESYFYKDLLFGQIAENWGKPIAEHATNVFSNLYYKATGENEKVKSELYTSKEAAQAGLSVLGINGMVISNAFGLAQGTTDLISAYNDKQFRLDKFGFVNAKDEIQLEEGDKNKKIPAFVKASQSAAYVSQVMSLLTGSPKELQIFTNKIPSINKAIITGMFGKNKNLITEKERYAKLEPKEIEGKKYYLTDDFSKVSFADVDYVLNTEQLKKRIKYKDEYVNAVYDKWNKQKATALQLKRPIYIQKLKDNPELIKKNSIQEKMDAINHPYEYSSDMILKEANRKSEKRILKDYTKELPNGKKIVTLKTKYELEQKK
jgi:hypothetical protein